jgi:hypothetical protein
MRAAELLDAHPEAEEILIAIAPQFKALKNRSCGEPWPELATLERAEKVAGLDQETVGAHGCIRCGAVRTGIGAARRTRSGRPLANL